MSKEPKKVEETAAPYVVERQKTQSAATAKPRSTEKRTVDAATFKKVADKIFSERKELLHKLAQ